jgi:hypothetical protein
VHWCALFSDVDHEIKEVYDGVRASLAYNICRKDGNSADIIGPRPLSMDIKEKTSAWVWTLRDLIETVIFCLMVEELDLVANISTLTD